MPVAFCFSHFFQYGIEIQETIIFVIWPNHSTIEGAEL